MQIAIVIIVALLVSVAVTGLVIGYARKRLLDSVNQRSMHRIATPRGGGVGLVMGTLVAWLTVGLLIADPDEATIGWFASLATVIVGMSVLGWWDDHAKLSARFRLSVQLALIGVVLFNVGIPGQLWLTVAWALPVAVWWYVPAAILGGGWMVNLTNFMDGIDGNAATQSSIGCVGLAVLLPTEANGLRLLLLACAAASVGFLVWNRPPAKIFMGDVGSTAIGLVFAIAILDGLRHGIALEFLLLPVAPFIADATCTLIRRAWLREQLHEAHRSHLFQRLAKKWESHLMVTLLFAGLAMLGTGLALAGASKILPPLMGVGLWGAVWAGFVIYGRHRCPAGGGAGPVS